jgi:hypothetical protein
MNIILTAAQEAGLNLIAAEAGLSPEEYANDALSAAKYEWSQRMNSIPSAAFVLRFTAAEISGIMAGAAAMDAGGVLLYPQLQAYLDRLASEPTVNLTNPDAIAGVQLLEASGMLAPGRAAEILAP